MKNKFESFIPLMHKLEYKLVEKYLNKNDILLEWGSGSSTIYFSGLVKGVLSIEHDIDYYNQVKKIVDFYNINNIQLFYVKGNMVVDQKKHRFEAFENYIKLPLDKKLKFTKVLIDGRARKYCAMLISEIISDNELIFIHDFNYNDVEGYVDDDYFSDILNCYDVIEFERSGQGMVVLKKKVKSDILMFDNRNNMFEIIGKNQIIAELGVFKGDFSDFIYKKLNPKELHLIDIFEGVTHSGDKDGDNIISIDLNQSYKNIKEKYKNKKNVIIHKGYGDKILKGFDNNYFDIIYIDASHSYEDVKKDLEVSFLKVKNGGLILGHDYDLKNHIEVFLAVNQFCFEKNLKINYLTNDRCPSYGIIKKNY